MFQGISEDMMSNVVEGKSPLCAIEKRIANGKMMAFNIGKAFGLIPKEASVKRYMKDDNRFWRESYFAQTDAESESHTGSATTGKAGTDTVNFDYS